MAFGTLLLLHPDGSRTTLSLEKTTTRIGCAAGNDVVLAHPQVADYHAQILCDTTGVQVLDLGSSAGTAIDDQPLEHYGLARFGFGQRLQVGPVWMLLYREAQPPPAPEPPRSRWSWPPAWWLRWRERARARKAQAAMVPATVATPAHTSTAPAAEVSEPAPGLIQRARSWHIPDWFKRIFIWSWLKQNGHRALAWFLGLVGFFWLRSFLSRWLGISPDLLNPMQLLDERKEPASQPRPQATPDAVPVSSTTAWHEPQHSTPPALPTIPVRRSEQLHLTIDPAELATDPGRAVALTVTVVNRSPLVDRVNFLVEGLPQSWVSITPPALSLMPGDSGSSEIVIRPPRDANSVAGTHPFVVAARSSDETEPGAALAASLAITPFHDFRLDFQPQQCSAWRRGHYELRIINNSNQAQAFALQGRDEAQALRFGFQPNQPLVTPGQVAPVQVLVRRRRPHPFGKPITSGFYLMVEPTNRATPAQQAQGQLIQRAVSWSLLLLLLLLPIFAYSLQFVPDAVAAVVTLIRRDPAQPTSTTAGGDSKSPSPSPAPTATTVSPTVTSVTDAIAIAATDSTSTATSATAAAQTAVAQVVATQVAATQTAIAQTAATQQAVAASQTEAAAAQTASAAAATGTAQAQAGQTEAAAAQTASAVGATGTAQAYLGQTQTAAPQTAAAVAATANAEAQIAAQIAAQTQAPYETASAATATAQTQATAYGTATAQAQATATTVYVATSSAVAVTTATAVAVYAITTATAIAQPNSLQITNSNIDKNATENFSITVQVLDRQGNRANSNNPPISLKIEGFDAASIITAPSLSLNPSNGEVTFSNLQIKRAGVYRLYAAAPDTSTMPQKESNRITIMILPGPATKLAFVCFVHGGQTSCLNSSVVFTADQQFGFIAQALDSYGNIDTSFQEPSAITINYGGNGTSLLLSTPAFNAGVLVFNTTSLPSQKVGPNFFYSFGSVDGTPAATLTPTFTVVPGAPAAIEAMGTFGGTLSTSYMTTFKVLVRDSRLNPVQAGVGVCFQTDVFNRSRADLTFFLDNGPAYPGSYGTKALTNSIGVVESPEATSNGISGSYKLYAYIYHPQDCDGSLFPLDMASSYIYTSFSIKNP